VDAERGERDRRREPALPALTPEALQAMLDRLPDAVVVTAPGGTVVAANEAALSQLGDETAGDVGDRFEAIAEHIEVRDTHGRIVPPERWPTARALAGEAVQGVEIVTTDRRTGDVRISEVDAGPVLDPQGRVAFAVTRSRDVTSARRERDELERLYASERIAKLDAERARELLERLNRMAVELAPVITTDEVAATSARLASEAAEAVAVGLVGLQPDGRTLRTIATRGMSPEVVDAWSEFSVDDEAPLAECVRLDQPVVVSSPTERRARYLGIEDATPKTIGRAWASFPLHRTGRVSGGIGFSFGEATTFPEADLAFLAGIAEHVSMALERAALLEDSDRARREAERSARRLRRLELVTDAALSDLPFDDLLVELLDRVRTALEGDTSTLLLVDDDGNLRVRASRGIPRDDAAVVVIPPGAGVAGRILASGRPDVIADVPSVPPRSHWLAERVHSLAGVPLRVRGDIVGVLHVGSAEPREFTDEDVRLLELVGARVASALERGWFYGDR